MKRTLNKEALMTVAVIIALAAATIAPWPWI
ncbi:hypothetical protein SAMN04489725_106125 [Alicyclobacillus hesperidum]|uniref:Uncharacterized protein n=1 Tax=Alicyclobacillus hesperidum TaxID=89784 RepID=A0A1H2TUY6_9BACL|nr:hypothetical protein SAMN04489725_106125 [Alicyclobacillus hesperidum]